MPVRSSTTRSVLRVKDTIDRRYADPLDLKELSAVAHLSVSQLSRVFRRQYGETPHAYLYRRRVERAQWLLRTTDDRIVDIAIAVGWSSVGTFTSTFRRLVGETPTEHRRRGRYPPLPSCVLRSWERPTLR